MHLLPSELTHVQANACLHMLTQGLRGEAGAEVAVDATALVRFDSSALAVLLEFRRECLAQGKTLVLRGLSMRLSDLAVLYGVGELLKVDAEA